MAAYYPLFDNLKVGPPGENGIGFKLTHDGNFDMTNRILTNAADPVSNNDLSTKVYVDNSVKELHDKSLLCEDEFNARNMQIKNIKEPTEDGDAVNKKHLDYMCILWDPVQKSYYCHNERLSKVKAPKHDMDVVNRHYLEMKLFCATTKNLVTIAGNGFQTYKFEEFSSKLLDSNMKLSQNMYMKITIFVASDVMGEKQRIRLEKVQELLFDRFISPNEDCITMFVYGKKDEVLTLSALPINRGSFKPYLHIEKIEFK